MQGGAADGRDPELASASGSVQRLQCEALRRSGRSEQSQSAQGRSHRLRPTFPYSRAALSVVDAAAERTRTIVKSQTVEYTVSARSSLTERCNFYSKLFTSQL